MQDKSQQFGEKGGHQDNDLSISRKRKGEPTGSALCKCDVRRE